MAGPLAHAGSWTPGEADLNNGGGISLGVRFTASEAKDLGGVSFYAPATNTGTYSYAIYETTTDDDPNGSGTGTLLAEDTIAAAGVVAGAWNDLPLPVNVTTGKVYTARVHTSSGRFVRTANVFGSASVSGNGITLLQAGSDPTPPGLGSMTNGVFLDAAVGYPHTSFNFADYGIDVWEAAAVEPIDVAGAITIGEAVVSGTASVQLQASGAITVGELAVSGALAHEVLVAGAVAIGEVAVSGALTHPITERPSGFETLTAMFRNARRDAGVRVRATECLYDGWPLESGRGVLHCTFCGRTY